MQRMAEAAGPRVPVKLGFAALHAAWLRARHGKRPSRQWLAFASRWLPQLQELHHDLRAGCWQPRRTVSFVVNRPKTREIHAPHFADRVVHHWLVPQLEALYEPVFIFDSHANRAGKGSHAAVERLHSWMRQRNGCGYMLQVDVHNFFNRIHRPTLYALLKRRIGKATSRGALTPTHGLALQSLCHKLLARPVEEHCLNPAAAARVPPHKRLRHARPACGLPIGNVTSQFFANVYLNELDQFVKHGLKAKHYVRYVDDMVLLADDEATLREWHARICCFLRDRLRLDLKLEHRLAPLKQGVDFLGYQIFPTHRLVRRRVVHHCRKAIERWARRHVAPGLRVGSWSILADATSLARLQHVLASYWGHFSHASSWRLRHALFQRYAWLQVLFTLGERGDLQPLWVLPGCTLAQQLDALRRLWPHARCIVQMGCKWLKLSPLSCPDGGRVHVAQAGWLRHGTRRREVFQWHHIAPPVRAGAAVL